MLTFEEALEKVLERAGRLGSERVPLSEAQGRVLAEPLVARESMPAFDYSAMDGYAVRTADFKGQGPWTLGVRGESRTGHSTSELLPHSACRIFTGAELPSGSDAVVMQEDVERTGDLVQVSQQPASGQNVRRAGEDLAVGDIALDEGTRLGPGQLGLAAALDLPALQVARRPRVTIVCTGDELRAPGEPARPGSIPDSNGVSLLAAARSVGARARLAPLARDDRNATLEGLRDALAESDVLVTVGGVSVGDHDVVRPALEAAGVKLSFYKVRIKPGKPLVFGMLDETRVLGLPGNPASALVTFTLFGVPLLRALQGDRRPLRELVLELGAPLSHKPGRRGYYRARIEGRRVLPLENQASGAPTGMAWADALIVAPEDHASFAVGEAVTVLPLEP